MNVNLGIVEKQDIQKDIQKHVEKYESAILPKIAYLKEENKVLQNESVYGMIVQIQKASTRR